MKITPIEIEGLSGAEKAYKLDDDRVVVVRLVRHTECLTTLRFLVSARLIDEHGKTIEEVPDKHLGVRKAGIVRGESLLELLEKERIASVNGLLSHIAAKEVWEQIPEDD